MFGNESKTDRVFYALAIAAVCLLELGVATMVLGWLIPGAMIAIAGALTAHAAETVAFG